MGSSTFGRARAAVVREQESRVRRVGEPPASTEATTVAAAPEEATVVPANVVREVTRTMSGVVEEVRAAQPAEERALQTLDATPPKSSAFSRVAGLEGEWGREDTLIPRLALVQKTSEIADSDPTLVGSFIYDGLFALGSELRIVVTGMRNFQEEVTEFGSGEIPAKFETLEEARASGVKTEKVYEVDLLFRADDPSLYEFCLVEVGEERYVPARMTLRRSGKTVAQVVATDLGRHLKGDLLSGMYDLRSEKIAGSKGVYYAPRVRSAGPPTDALRERLRVVFDR